MSKIKDGLYLLHRHDYPVSESTAIKLVQELLKDLKSGNPHIQWSYNPERSNLQTFVGIGLNGGQNSVKIEKKFAPHDQIQVHLEYCEGTIILYSITDLCYDPKTSSLLQLYAEIASLVYTTAVRSCSH